MIARRFPRRARGARGARGARAEGVGSRAATFSVMKSVQSGRRLVVREHCKSKERANCTVNINYTFKYLQNASQPSLGD